MALHQSALTDLLDALRSGGDLDFLREAMQLVLQALIELEATPVIGAGRRDLVLLPQARGSLHVGQ
jgi:putative transposase